MLPNGAHIDTTHFTDEEAANFWKQLKDARDGKRTTVTISLPAAYSRLTITYDVNVKGLDSDTLKQVGAGIWWDFQIRFELWEGTLGAGAGRGISTFRNEDIPTTYIAYVAAVHGGESKGWGFNDVMNKLGGATLADSEVYGGGWSASTKNCMNNAVCDGNTPRNNTIYLKVQNGDGTWGLVSYPPALDAITPNTDSKYFSYNSCITGC